MNASGIKSAKCRACGSEMIGIETTGEIPALRASNAALRAALRLARTELSKGTPSFDTIVAIDAALEGAAK